MIYSFKLSWRLASYITLNLMKKKEKFPFVLMMEPLFKCNLSCSGCGRIREYKDILNKVLSVEECMDAARQAQAPVVSITGGEPLLHPEIKEIISNLISENFFVYLCTNGLLLEDFLDEIKPHCRLSIVVHLDGMSKTHDSIAGRKDIFYKAIKGIKKAKKMNFSVRTNTTIYKNTDVEEISDLFGLLKKIGTDGIMVSPAFSYEILSKDSFLSRNVANRVFERIYTNLNGSRLYNTPLYWEFLRGKRDLQCIPWANPTVNPGGWKSPCYLITDKHYTSFKEMMEETDWDNYGVGKDPRCKNCMVHCGYEASSILGSINLADLLKVAWWNITGRS